jgi:catechol 2,3-dioxygenase-like lactoylglutathione lyase family enzyme
MEVSFYHVKLNVSDLDFYKGFLKWLGFEISREFARGFGASDGQVGIWVFKTPKSNQQKFNYKNTGLNHLAFKVGSKEAVDKFYKEYLLPNNISVLHSPEEHRHYNSGKGYYAVFFEDPDHIKLEVAWVAK